MSVLEQQGREPGLRSEHSKGKERFTAKEQSGGPVGGKLLTGDSKGQGWGVLVKLT